MWNADWFYCFLMKKSSFISEINILPFHNLIYTLDNKLKLLKPFTSFHDKLARIVGNWRVLRCKTWVSIHMDPEGKLGFGENPYLPTRRAPAHPSHLLLSLVTEKTSCTRCCTKDTALADAGWAGFGFICFTHMGKGSGSVQWEKRHWWKKPNVNTGIIKMLLDKRAKDLIKKGLLISLSWCSFQSPPGTKPMAEEKADAVGAEQETWIRAAPTPRCWFGSGKQENFGSSWQHFWN